MVETVWKQIPKQPCFLAVMKYLLAALPVAFSNSLISHLLLNMNFNSLFPGENAKALHVLNVHQI